MEEQINLWPYFKTLMVRWPWVLGASFLAATITFVTLTLLPAHYESTALIAVVNTEVLTLESLTIQDLDPRFKTETVANPFVKIYPELALSEAIVKDLLSRYQDRLENIDSVDGLRDMLSVQLESDNSVLRMTVLNMDQELAMDIANSWVNLFVHRANDLVDIERLQKLDFLEQQLDEANTNLLTAESALTFFQNQNRLSIINNSLSVLSETQTDYLEQLERLRLLTMDVTALHEQIVNSNMNNVSTSDQLTALFLQLRAFNVDFSSSSPVEISLDETLTGTSRQEHTAFLSNLLVILETKNEQITQLLETVEPQILRLQEQRQEAEVEQRRLLRELSSAEETYTALVRRVVEEGISAEEPINTVQLISEPNLPTRPVDTNRLMNTAIAGAFTFLIASFLMLGQVWWQQLVKKQTEADDEK